MEDSSQARGSQMQSTSQRNGGVLSVKGWASVKLSEFLPEHRPPDPADTIPILCRTSCVLPYPTRRFTGSEDLLFPFLFTV